MQIRTNACFDLVPHLRLNLTLVVHSRRHSDSIRGPPNSQLSNSALLRLSPRVSRATTQSTRLCRRGTPSFGPAPFHMSRQNHCAQGRLRGDITRVVSYPPTYSTSASQHQLCSYLARLCTLRPCTATTFMSGQPLALPLEDYRLLTRRVRRSF